MAGDDLAQVAPATAPRRPGGGPGRCPPPRPGRPARRTSAPRTRGSRERREGHTTGLRTRLTSRASPRAPGVSLWRQSDPTGSGMPSPATVLTVPSAAISSAWRTARRDPAGRRGRHGGRARRRAGSRDRRSPPRRPRSPAARAASTSSEPGGPSIPSSGSTAFAAATTAAAQSGSRAQPQVEGAVRLHVGDPTADRGGAGDQRAELVDRLVGHPVRRGRHLPTSHPLAVGVADVGADPDARLDRRRAGRPHRGRVAGVEAAGDVGARRQRQQLEVGGQLLGADPLAEVGVQVDRHRREDVIGVGRKRRERAASVRRRDRFPAMRED